MKNQDLTYLNGLAISCLATGLVDTAQPAFELISDAAPEHAAGPIGLASVELARGNYNDCLLYTSPSPRDATLSRMPSSA